MSEAVRTGYPSIDKPWNRYFDAVDAVAGTKGVEIPECSIYEYLQECNADNLDGNALDYFGKTITYRELFDRVEGLAKAMKANGVKPGDVVNIVTINSVEGYELEYACNRVGALFDFVSVASEDKDLVQYYKDSKAELIFVLDLFAEKALKAAKEAGFAKKVIILDLADEMPFVIKMGYKLKMRGKVNKEVFNDPMVQRMPEFRKMGQNEVIDFKKDPNTPAVYAHTGGTTGFPKTVLLNDKAYNSVAATYRKYMPLVKGGYCLNCTVPFVVFSNSVGMHMPMCAASCCHIVVPQWDAAEWPKYFKKYPNINFLVCVPAQIAPWLEDPKMKDVDLSCIKVLGCGGDGMTNAFESDMKKFLADHGCEAGNITYGYGMTEVGASACTTYPNGLLHLRGVSDDIPTTAVGSVGFPHPINEFVIWDNDNNCECKYDEIGEICMLCASEMIEYKDNPKETADIHKTHPNGKTYIHTGDLGYFNEDGLLFISGRIKRIFLTFREDEHGARIGYKCFPAYTEEVIATHPAISQVCCVEMKNDEDHRIKAFVAPREDSNMSEADLENELRKMAEDNLTPYQVPYAYEFRSKLPTTAVGKIDFQTLEKQA